METYLREYIPLRGVGVGCHASLFQRARWVSETLRAQGRAFTSTVAHSDSKSLTCAGFGDRHLIVRTKNSHEMNERGEYRGMLQERMAHRN